MKTITINGKQHVARPMSEAEACIGAVVRNRFGRGAYRILCFDGADAIMRDVRRPESVVIWEADQIPRDFLIVEQE